MEFINRKVELDEEEEEMKRQGYKFKLWLETERDGGERFRNNHYFYTKEEMEKYIKMVDDKCRLWEDYWISDMEIIDLEKGELI